jgi:hypothetical protein
MSSMPPSTPVNSTPDWIATLYLLASQITPPKAESDTKDEKTISQWVEYSHKQNNLSDGY